MRTLIPAAAAALLAAPCLAQTVTVAVEGSATAAPGEVVQLTVTASAPDLPAGGAFGGYGLDLDITAGASAATGFSPAVSSVMTLGTQAGTPSAAALDGVVGGQLSNVFGLNPSVDQSSPIVLFTTDLTIDAGAALGTDITIEASAFSGGGVVIYPDINAGANVTAPDAPGTSLSFTPLTITVQAPGACVGDVNGDGSTDVFDFSDLAANFGAGPGATLAQGDITGDGFVDVFDFGELAADFGCTQ